MQGPTASSSFPPKLKKSCERCKRKRIHCSYRVDGGNGVDSCEACEEAETPCLAARLKSSVSLGEAMTRSFTPAPPVQKRVYVSCNQCRYNNLRCNLKRDQPGPCSKCERRGENCAFVLIPISASNTASITPSSIPKESQKKACKKQVRRTRAKDQIEDGELTPGRPGGTLERTLGKESFHHGAGSKRKTTLRREQERLREHTTKKQQKKKKERAQRKHTSRSGSYDPESTPPPGMTNAIPHIRIKTAFSHPITFNYKPDLEDKYPCSWCSSPFFGLFGHDTVETEVIPYPAVNGFGYEEIFGGHHGKGIPLSQMCITCTFARVTIMGCENHNFKAIEIDPRSFIPGEMEKSVNALLENDKKGGELAEQTKWCSICPTHAAFKCCNSQQNGATGCGLHVCEACQDLMFKIARNYPNAPESLDRAIHHASRDHFGYEFGVRADASFLSTTGELNLRIQKGFGMELVEEHSDEAISSEGDENEEAWDILERVRKGKGEGKGKWSEKQKGAEGGMIPPVPVVGKEQKRAITVRKGLQRMPALTSETVEKPEIRMGVKLSSQGSGKGQSQGGLRGVVSDEFEEGREGNRDKTIGNEFSRSVKREAHGKPEVVGKMSQIIFISDDDDD